MTSENSPKYLLLKYNAFLYTMLGVLLISYACDYSVESNLSESGGGVKKPETQLSVDYDDLYNSISSNEKYNIRTVGVLIFDGVNSLDAMGASSVLGSIPGAKIVLIGLKSGSVKTWMGLEIVPETVIDSVTQLDILVIPGGFTSVYKSYDHRLHDWIREIDKHSVFTTSVCSGGWILGATGLLEGRNATTNWYRAEEFMTKYGANYKNERYVQDGKYWTSAGVTAGIDMSLALINHMYGEDYTQSVMLDLEYNPAPPIAGGDKENTTPKIYDMMLSRYDDGFKPAIDSMESVH